MPDSNIVRRMTNVQRYALGVASALFALALRGWLTPLLGDESRYHTAWVAVAFCAWYCGLGPALLSVVISAFGLWFWFEGSRPTVAYKMDLWGLFWFLVFSAVLIALAEAVRRAKAKAEQSEELLKASETQLRLANDNMADEIRQRTAELEQKSAQTLAQARLLDLANDAIFVRDSNDRISYWNEGAEHLYGWTKEEAVGRPVHELLRTVFPGPIDEIANSERWEGELVQVKRDGSCATVASRWTTLRDERGKLGGWLEICTDITGRKQLEEAARRLTGRVLSMQDDERRRIARELHDSLGQYLASVKINLDLLAKTISDPQLSSLILESIAATEQSLTETRTISHLLHPPLLDEAGFASAARWYVEGFAQRSSFQVELDLPRQWHPLDRELETALFRILQEALTNVHRHSGGSGVWVFVRTDAEQVHLEIRDNGRGIPPERLRRLQDDGSAIGVGIAGMRERLRELGGSLRIASAYPGTTLTVTIPLRQGSESAPEESNRDVSAA